MPQEDEWMLLRNGCGQQPNVCLIVEDRLRYQSEHTGHLAINPSLPHQRRVPYPFLQHPTCPRIIARLANWNYLVIINRRHLVDLDPQRTVSPMMISGITPKIVAGNGSETCMHICPSVFHDGSIMMRSSPVIRACGLLSSVDR